MIYGEGMKMNDVYKVYIRRDDAERIIDVNSDAFLTETNDWTQIDEGVGDRYHHAQNNYFPKPPYDDNGIPSLCLRSERLAQMEGAHSGGNGGGLCAACKSTQR